MGIVELRELQKATHKTAVYPKEQAVVYTALGLAGESGEVANKVKKVLRGDGVDEDTIGREVFDVIWYCSELLTALGLDIEDVVSDGLARLRDRQGRGVIKGSGDNR